jgi:hypothetical protein
MPSVEAHEQQVGNVHTSNEQNRRCNRHQQSSETANQQSIRLGNHVDRKNRSFKIDVFGRVFLLK